MNAEEESKATTRYIFHVNHLLAEKITYKAHNASACHINNGSYQGKLLDS